MNNNTFTKEDFDVFKIEGLEQRMTVIRNQLQPKFRALGQDFAKEIAVELNQESLPVHIAQHLRRTKNAPKDTWLAIGGDKRGYKKYPHFQLGLYETHLFIWLAFIDNPLHEEKMALQIIEDPSLLFKIPDDYVVSWDHTKETVIPLTEADLLNGLIRWQTVKKGEFLIGRQLLAEDPILKDPKAMQEYILNTFIELVPLYKQAYSVYDSQKPANSYAT